MGIINLTPDSFYAKSRVKSVDSCLLQAKNMIEEGAVILDLGAYSSRPGADDIDPQEEKKRLIPSVEAIRKEFPEILISVDTFRAEIAEEALNCGADIINDISGGMRSEEMYTTVAKHKVPYVMMHMRGTPKTMTSLTDYNNLIEEIMQYFRDAIVNAKNQGVEDIMIDPGFGFGKTMDQNYELLQQLPVFQDLNCPILVGISRKSMIYKKLGISAEESLTATSALHLQALLSGAAILRVHDVKEASQMIRLAEVLSR